jgi:catechol 2,3-dioxygenase-like lactoylglutathione lyase family enzyme
VSRLPAESGTDEHAPKALSITPVLPVPDLAEAVAYWTDLLGIAPTFVDGDRWAQFDLGPSRLALAGTDRMTDAAGVMVKVETLDAVEHERGPHEDRAFVTDPAGHPVVLYRSPS